MIPGIIDGQANIGAGGGGNYVGPLDLVSGAVVAYGQRALSAAMVGQPLYTLRRSSDDAEVTYNSDASGNPPVATISAWIGDGSGFLKTWNDHSGNAIDAAQTTSANQPQWVSGVSNERPGLSFDGTNDHLITGGVNLTGAVTAFFVLYQPSLNLNAMIFCGGDVNVGPDIYIGTDNVTGTKLLSAADDSGFSNGAGSRSADAFNTTIAVVDVSFSTLTASLFYNGSAVGVDADFSYGDGSWAVNAPMAIGTDRTDTPTLFLNGQLLELIVYPSVLPSDDRLVIRQNQATYYGITLP